MELPSARELELEALLRQRETQAAELTDEITRLRQYLSTQPSPSTSDPTTLPPALISILLPHINNAISPASSRPTSSTVTAALTARAKLLQEENEELYGLLKFGETGQLKEEVRALRRVVDRLKGALQESHTVIANLTSELDKSYETYMASNRAPKHQPNNAHAKARAQSKPNAYAQSPPAAWASLSATSQAQPTNGSALNANSKVPPTGPRAYKKPRLVEFRKGASPPQPPPGPEMSSTSTSSPRANSAREYRPARAPADERESSAGYGNPDGEEEDGRKRPRSSPDRDAERERERERDRERDRDRGRERQRKRMHRDVYINRDRDRDSERERSARDRLPRRNGAQGGGRGSGTGSSAGPGGGGVSGGERRRNARTAVGPAESHAGGDRTLAERMGL